MNRRIKILFLAANPIDSDRLRLDEEIRHIDQALRQSDFRDRFEIRQHWAVRVSELQNFLLRHKPDIVHFSGHGSEDSHIYLEDDSGESYAVPGEALGQLFRVLKDNIKCVVLNACYSQAQARAIARAIDCVIGMSQEIGDKSSIRFAAAFYQALGFGKDAKTAFDLGINQLDLEQLADSATPTLINPKRNAKKLTFVDVVNERVRGDSSPSSNTKRTRLLTRRGFLPALAGSIIMLLGSALFVSSKIKHQEPLESRPVELSGEVRDTARQPIAGATITVVSTHLQTQSASDGAFIMDLDGKNKGDLLKIAVSCDGYKTVFFDRRISRQKERLNIRLQRESE